MQAAYSPKLSSGSDKWQRSLFRFDLSAIPAGAYVNSATFGVRSPVAALNTSGVELRRVVRPWTSQESWTRYDGKNKWTNAGGDYEPEVFSSVSTSERGAQAGWWSFPLSAFRVEEAKSKAESLNFLAKLIDDKVRECNATECTQRLLRLESSAAAKPESRPYLSVVYYQKSPNHGKVTSPWNGTVTACRLKLVAAGMGATAVTFQYRMGEGENGRFQTISPSDVQTIEGQPVSWPMPVEGTHSKALIFDTSHLTKMGFHAGTVQIRALFDGTSAVAGYSAPVTASVSSKTGGAADAMTQIGPGTLDLRPGHERQSHRCVDCNARRELGIWPHQQLAHGRHFQRRCAGRGWEPSIPVEEAGADWRNVREVIPTAEEAEVGIPPYLLLTDPEGYGYSFEKEGETYVTPPELSGWLLVRQDASHLTLTDPGGNRTTFENSGGGTEYLPCRFPGWEERITKPR